VRENRHYVIFMPRKLWALIASGLMNKRKLSGKDLISSHVSFKTHVTQYHRNKSCTKLNQDSPSHLKIIEYENLERSWSMARYGKKAAQKVKRAMHERKRGTLKSGRSGKKVTSRKQAIAIGLSEARRAGGKVPSKKSKRK
jgi:Family of unknown function (DUF6496)